MYTITLDISTSYQIYDYIFLHDGMPRAMHDRRNNEEYSEHALCKRKYIKDLFHISYILAHEWELLPL